MEKYSWVAEGSSFVLSDVLAALLDAQLNRLDAIQKRREWVVATLPGRSRRLGTVSPRRAPPRRSSPTATAPYHIFYLICPDRLFRDRLLDGLRARGVQAAFHFVPLHTSPMGRELGEQPELPVTERIASTLVRLPLHPLLSEDEVARVVDSVLALA